MWVRVRVCACAFWRGRVTAINRKCSSGAIVVESGGQIQERDKGERRGAEVKAVSEV